MTDDRAKPDITSDSVAERFTNKMRALELSAKEREIAEAATHQNLSYINLKGFPIGPETLITIPREQAMALRVICFLNIGGEIRLGAVKFDDARVRELAWQLGERSGANVKIYAISEESFTHALKLYDALPQIQPITRGVKISEEELAQFQAGLDDIRALSERIRAVPTTDLVALIIAGAIQTSSSDIHVEAAEKESVLRYRIDGVLHSVAEIPGDRTTPLVNRLKLLAELKLNVDDVPQDGRFTIKLIKGKIDVRVSTLPTAFGESVVMRLLRPSTTGLIFEDLGVRGRAHEQLAREVERPNGMILTTGPTGSGKTTTLYAIVNRINKPQTKIITLEDPIEYELAGINQSQIDPSKDYTFAKGLRAILRQDPDVVMVGEIRDLETVEVAIQAALTGHLLLSTIHTNSAAGAIPRFLSMGAKPFLLAPALNAIIGQRLVRRIHDDCRTDDPLNPETKRRVEEIIASLPEDERTAHAGKSLQFSRGRGCAACHGTGYKGRVGIFEVLTMSKEIEALILSEDASEYRAQETAVSQGMITMLQDGILKTLDGITSVDEVFRVVE
ncbi:MAG: GspE/PulE family protein [Candidatus Uhrbacteria bacterium]